MNEKMLKMLNEQVTNEIYSSLLYLQMAAWCEYENLSGFAHWMNLQSQEELDHVKIFYRFIADRGGLFEIGEIPKAPKNYSSPLDVLEQSLEHERLVTKAIHDLMEAAMDIRDYPTISFLDWFVKEQVEEEASLSNLIESVKRIGKSGEGIFMLDSKMGQRAYAMPTSLAEKK